MGIPDSSDLKNGGSVCLPCSSHKEALWKDGRSVAVGIHALSLSLRTDPTHLSLRTDPTHLSLRTDPSHLSLRTDEVGEKSPRGIQEDGEAVCSGFSNFASGDLVFHCFPETSRGPDPRGHSKWQRARPAATWNDSGR